MPKNVQNYCEGGGKSLNATIADYADKIAKGADAASLGLAAAGIVAAPTGAGLVGFELAALGAKGISMAANLTSAYFNYQAGNTGAAINSGIGFVAGSAVGSLVTRGVGGAMAARRAFGDLNAGQVRKLGYASGLAGSLSGDNAESIAKIGCGVIAQ